MGCDEFVASDKERWLEISPTMTFDPGNWATHYLFYYLCKLMLARETVEIGVGRGHGTYMFGLHAKEVGGHHTAIDVNPHHANRALFIKEKYDLPIDILVCDSKAVMWRKKVHIVYVDGLHTTEQVKGDIENFAPWIVRNGLMVFDDYGKKHHGVAKAVDDLFDPDVWDMMTWPFNWWAIWRRK